MPAVSVEATPAFEETSAAQTGTEIDDLFTYIYKERE